MLQMFVITTFATSIEQLHQNILDCINNCSKLYHWSCSPNPTNRDHPYLCKGEDKINESFTEVSFSTTLELCQQKCPYQKQFCLQKFQNNFLCYADITTKNLYGVMPKYMYENINDCEFGCSIYHQYSCRISYGIFVCYGAQTANYLYLEKNKYPIMDQCRDECTQKEGYCVRDLSDIVYRCYQRVETNTILIIACSTAGGILILVVGLVIWCACCCVKKRERKYANMNKELSSTKK